ncbi:hypothetical protein BCR36DRAFT_410980 [Piromyces finnis]|uniref:Uncharacterized protein n=1 Tax=Piromyces finnis TaxID=1754191 RepID=A0A1Y1VFV2_9FUNG|nr:hypothetical protein BCR36DRAFT_410980 [Piromyces finnis]|eukprot:ORX53831.1 hypothetical protein BCR36DRAFT_410980 [Piromyces finnis]
MKVIFENCEFTGITVTIFSVSLVNFKCKSNINDSYHFELRNCYIHLLINKIFKSDNKQYFKNLISILPQNKDDNLDCFNTKISNCLFHNNKNIFKVHLKNTDGDEKESMASIMVSKFLNNKITIKNTIFKSNIVEKNMPLFYFFKTNIE